MYISWLYACGYTEFEGTRSVFELDIHMQDTDVPQLDTEIHTWVLQCGSSPSISKTDASRTTPCDASSTLYIVGNVVSITIPCIMYTRRLRRGHC
jgi:hypothetical protein